MLEALPPFSGEDLVRMWNAGLRSAIPRVLASSTPSERARERAAFIARAATVTSSAGRSSAYAIARDLHDRMLKLVQAQPSFLDAGTLDGCLGAALLIDGWEAPCERTIRNALRKSPPLFVPEGRAY